MPVWRGVHHIRAGLFLEVRQWEELPPLLLRLLVIPLKGSKPEKKLFLPEMLHNVQLLVDQTEQDIVRTDRKLRYNRDLVVNLAHEKEQREAQLPEEEQQIDKLTQILGTIKMSVCNESSVPTLVTAF